MGRDRRRRAGQERRGDRHPGPAGGGDGHGQVERLRTRHHDRRTRRARRRGHLARRLHAAGGARTASGRIRRTDPGGGLEPAGDHRPAGRRGRRRERARHRGNASGRGGRGGATTLASTSRSTPACTGSARFPRPWSRWWTRSARRANRVEVAGIFTHFADAAERRGLHHRSARADSSRRWSVLRPVAPDALLHTSGSAAILAHPAMHHDLVRAGIAFYGYPPVPAPASLRPAMHVFCRVAQVRTVAAGRERRLRAYLARGGTAADRHCDARLRAGAAARALQPRTPRASAERAARSSGS